MSGKSKNMNIIHYGLVGSELMRKNLKEKNETTFSV